MTKRTATEADLAKDYESLSKKICSTDLNVMTASLDVFAVENEIHFTAGVTTETIQKLISHITMIIHKHKEKLEKKDLTDDKLDIIIIIDSPGGSVSSALKFIDFINLMKKNNQNITFTSIIAGVAASAGTLMAIATDKRYMTKYAHAMIHELSSGNRASYTHLMSYISHVTKLHNNIVEIYMDKTTHSKEKIEELMKNETWFSSDEYLKFGFIDAVK